MKNNIYSLNNWLAVDSNCFTYLFQAMIAGYDPRDDSDSALAIEKSSMLKIFLYVGNLYVLPDVKDEVKQIRDQSKLNGHLLLWGVLLRNIDNLDNNQVMQYAKQYAEFHGKQKDCRILAQAEVAGLDFLLTFDQSFFNNLKDKTQSVCLLKPSNYLERLNIPAGSRPKLIPDSLNPLSAMDWWKI